MVKFTTFAYLTPVCCVRWSAHARQALIEKEQGMASSHRRLTTIPSGRKARKMESPLELVDVFLAHHRAIVSSGATIRHYEDSLKLLIRCFADEGIEPIRLRSPKKSRWTSIVTSASHKPWLGRARNWHGQPHLQLQLATS
jgi:hypothetical protein